MKALLVRVGIDSSCGGSHGVINSRTGEFVYVPIPESSETHPELTRHYAEFAPSLTRMGRNLPAWLTAEKMHLDPDFSELTYGDQGERAKQISKLGNGDLLVFYAGLRDIQKPFGLVYGLIGLYVIENIIFAREVPKRDWAANAHTRRKLNEKSNDIVVRAKADVSGRLNRCLPIGNFRNRAYRILPELLHGWGGMSVNDGYLQRSARLPMFNDAQKFYQWFLENGVSLQSRNN